MLGDVVRWGVAVVERYMFGPFGLIAIPIVLMALWSVPLVWALGVDLAILLLWRLPKWQAGYASTMTEQERFERENEARKTLAQIVGGAAVLAGLYFTSVNLQITQTTAMRNQEITQEGQITERLTRAVDQLGNEKLEIRLGGITSLARIARDSKKDHQRIIAILTAYIRANAPWPPKQDQLPEERFKKLKEVEASDEERQLLMHIQWALPVRAMDIQAALSAIGHRARHYEEEDNTEIILWYTDLRRAFVRKAYLESAVLSGAHLEDALLEDTYLNKAILRGAHLEGADFERVRLDGADLTGAYLNGAQNLTVAQLSTVKSLYKAHIDPPLMDQIKRQYPHLLEKPSKE
jgi:uncharacterized protein YjbI with pentapeptide repeats